jgi:hypothetical protein
MEWLQQEIDSDPAHTGRSAEEFFESDVFSVVFEDSTGPLFVVRYSRILKADLQFCRASKQRIVLGFMERFPLVIANATAQGYKQLQVNTQAKSLRRWCEKHLGFKHFCDDLSRILARPK